MMDYRKHFEDIVAAQTARVERLKNDTAAVNYQDLDKIIIGIIGGDGIGPAITAHARRVLESLLSDEVASGKVEFRTIEGLTIENRAAAGKAIPEDVLTEIKNATCFSKDRQRHRARETNGPM